MPLAVAALTFLLVVALIAGITWSFEGTRQVRQRLAAGPSAGLGVEGDLLRVEAGRGPDGNRAGPPSAIAWRASPNRRAIPGWPMTFSSMSAAVPSSASCWDGCGPASSSGGSGWPPSWAPLPSCSWPGSGRSACSSSRRSSPTGSTPWRAPSEPETPSAPRSSSSPKRCRIQSAANSAGYSRKRSSAWIPATRFRGWPSVLRRTTSGSSAPPSPSSAARAGTSRRSWTG